MKEIDFSHLVRGRGHDYRGCGQSRSVETQSGKELTGFLQQQRVKDWKCGFGAPLILARLFSTLYVGFVIGGERQMPARVF